MWRSMVGLMLFFVMVGSPTLAFDQFITTDKDRLVEGSEEFRFISFNVPCFLDNADKPRFGQRTRWRFPNEFEITDALISIRQMGGTVARTYVPVKRATGKDSIPCGLNGPGKVNEQALQTLDRVLAIANKTGVRMIISLFENWERRDEVTSNATAQQQPLADVSIDQRKAADLQQSIRAIVQRTNALTGVKYCDDRAVLGWETSHQALAPPNWSSETAALIKSLDRNHLVIDSFDSQKLSEHSINDPNIDVVTTFHSFSNHGVGHQALAANRAKLREKKPYFVGLSGLIPVEQEELILNTIIQQDISGCLLWSLYYRNRDGGFYRRPESVGQQEGRAYHWTGMTTDQTDGRMSFLGLVQAKAFDIRGLATPPVRCPDPPRLLPIADHGAISWQGSVGATSYSVDRGWSPNGPWFAAGTNISELIDTCRPLFVDTQAAFQREYFYRVAAANEAGISSASNVVGPVTVNNRLLVDALADMSSIHAYEGDTLQIQTDDAWRFKHDNHRLAGKQGDWFVYSLEGNLKHFRVDVFYQHEITGLQFAVSSDGREFNEITARREHGSFDDSQRNRGSWNLVRYEADVAEPAHQLKIRFVDSAQVGHVVLQHDW